MKNIYWYTICQIYKKRVPSLLTILMLAVTISVVFYTLLLNKYNTYNLQQAEKLLMDDTSNVYKLEYRIMLAPLLPDELSELSAFYDEISGWKEISKCGMYTDYDNYKLGVKELYVQEKLIGLCRLETASGVLVQLGTEGEYGMAYVGCELADAYPKGSVYEAGTGERYIIKDVLRKNSKWLPRQSGDALMDMDCSILLDYDYWIEAQPPELYNGIGGYYYATEDRDVHNKIMKLAEQYGLEFYGTYNLKDQYKYLKRDILRNNVELVLMPAVMYIAAVMTIILLSVKSLADNRTDYGIMLANGMTKRQIMAIVIVESVFKMVVAGLTAALYWSVNIGKQGLIFLRPVIASSIVTTIGICLVTLILANIVPLWLLRKYRISDML
ncbi:MAG: hypothetical protein K2G45_11055 [Lachnospiraceae bacterium]|nr:hypothetical protein [Lachnospiraceae bacterium]